MPREDGLPPGTLSMLILRVLAAQPLHGYAIAQRIHTLSREELSVEEGSLDPALQEEMEAHRAMMGEPRWFGNTLQLREKSRDVWGWAWLDAIVRDIRFAGRGLRRTPVFTLVATASLALGLALTT